MKEIDAERPLRGVLPDQNPSRRKQGLWGRTAGTPANSTLCARTSFTLCSARQHRPGFIVKPGRLYYYYVSSCTPTCLNAPPPGRPHTAPPVSVRAAGSGGRHDQRTEAGFHFGPAQNQRLGRRRAAEDAPQRQRRTSPGRAGCREPAALRRQSSRGQDGPARGRAAAEHAASQSRRNARVRSEEAPGRHAAARPPGRAARAPPPRPPGPSPGERPPPPVGAAASRQLVPQSVLGEPRRKDAGALGGGELIKGKEPAAGGSGRFSCPWRCCLGFGPPEGRSLEGRRCRPH